MKGIASDKFICLDCETTGLDPKKDRIIEIAVVLFQGTEILERFESLADPKEPISEESIAIHHITQEMVAGKPTIDELLPEVLRYVKKYPIVGHGIGFDVAIIDEEAKRARVPCNILENPLIDTLRLARLYGESPVNSLEHLRKHFNIPLEGAHRAMSDVIVNVQVFQHLAKSFASKRELMQRLEKPIKMKTMPLGKYKGRPIRDLPINYLCWAAKMDFDQDLLHCLFPKIDHW